MSGHIWKACNRIKRFGGSNPPLSAYLPVSRAFSVRMETAAFCFLRSLFGANYRQITGKWQRQDYISISGHASLMAHIPSV